MNVIDYSNINRGTRGIFEDIEKQANNFTSKCLILMAVISIFLIVMASFEDQSDYMTEVRIADSWFVELLLILTFVDPSMMLLYAIPVVLAIWYHSVIFTLFVSVINIVFAFFRISSTCCFTDISPQRWLLR